MSRCNPCGCQEMRYDKPQGLQQQVSKKKRNIFDGGR